jgi:hypothetical protein
MADETFRPQKKPISAEEINQENETEDQNQNIIQDIEKEIQTPKEGGVKISGKVPEAFKNALASQRMGGGSKSAKETPSNKQSDMRVTGSSKLEELIAGISSKGNMIYEKIELPSKGKFYSGDDGPTDGVVHIRPMTGEEEEILATPRFVKKGQAINMIFNRCMQENFDSANFLTQDRTYLLIYLRGISYTPEYDVEVKDPDSDQTFATTINLNELYVNYCNDNFSSNNLEDVLPVTSYRFRYRLATGKDEQAVQEYRERRAKNFDLSGQADDTLLYRTAYLLEEIEGLSNKLEIQTLLKKLPIQDVAYLRTVVNDPPFGVETKISVNNPYTLNDFEIELPLEANFFFPRAKRRTSATQA